MGIFDGLPVSSNKAVSSILFNAFVGNIIY